MLKPTAVNVRVGREEELELLLRRWERAKAGAGQVVLISGEPGLGKSRITVALQDRLRGEPHIPLRYFCSPHHSDTALYPLVSQLEHAARIGRDDTPGGKLEKLRAVLARSATPYDEISLFAGLLSLPTDNGGLSTELGPERVKERSLLAFLRQIERLAAGVPVLMVFEDAHWSDPTSIEFLSLAIERICGLSAL